MKQLWWSVNIVIASPLSHLLCPCIILRRVDIPGRANIIENNFQSWTRGAQIDSDSTIRRDHINSDFSNGDEWIPVELRQMHSARFTELRQMHPFKPMEPTQILSLEAIQLNFKAFRTDGSQVATHVPIFQTLANIFFRDHNVQCRLYNSKGLFLHLNCIPFGKSSLSFPSLMLRLPKVKNNIFHLLR